MDAYSQEQGERLVKAARNSIELMIIDPLFQRDMIKSTVEQFEQRHGVFVTLRHYPTMELRGNAGFARPLAPLGELLVDAAIAAGFEDSKFVSVSKHELDDLLVEVSVLSSPVQVIGSEKKRLDSVQVGRDGLMVQYGHYGGLLLPAEAAENKWDKRRFMEEICRKVRIHANYWAQPNVKLYKFEAQLFREESPGGNVIEVKYDKDVRKRSKY